ncbi:MAG: hypothetical protein AB7U82_13530 [Blastocatellales bacterium]
MTEERETNHQTLSPADAFTGTIDHDELARLIAALRDHDCARSPRRANEDDDRGILQAVCLTLIAGPSELSIEFQPSPLLDQINVTLREAEPDDLPEARVCRLWLSCAAGTNEPDAANQFAALAEESLWPPALALVYRALSCFGRRRSMANLLPLSDSLSLAQADAWLEATHAADPDERFLDRLDASNDEWLPAAIRDRWRLLLAAEAALACGSLPTAIEETLAAMASETDEQPARGLAEAVSRRLSARAAAALARAQLAQGRGDDGALGGPASLHLPAWEREYLRALSRWHLGDQEAATTCLRTALDLNPHQTPTRLALAALLAGQSPEIALQTLEHDEPTREIYAARAALLARLGRYREAEETLDRVASDATVGAEPARFSWARGREQARRREQALRAALAEHHGDWNTADKSWRAACAEEQHRSLLEARQLFAAGGELRALAAGQNWRRGVLEQRAERLRRQLGEIPLGADAMFFRAVAMMDAAPHRAIKDFQTLLRRRAWVEAERRAGGGRIVRAGDTLLSLGQVEEAIRAYRLVDSDSTPGVKERLAVASVYAEVMRRSGATAITGEADQAMDLAPGSPWPQWLAALGLMIAGESEIAMKRLAASVNEDADAPELIRRCLQAVCAALSGAGDDSMTDEELAALNMPPETEAVVRLLCGAGDEIARIEALVESRGEAWIERCPVDAQSVARRLIAAWREQGDWDRALELARQLERSGQAWAVEMAALTRVRHALERACQGKLAEAEAELREVEATL